MGEFMKDNWLLYLGLGFGAYVLYEMSKMAATSASSVTGYLPIVNAQGNEFTCPAGTIYEDQGEQTNGGGICV
jgi:hypothetical protein